jgi:FkbM family methyltransferase
MLTNQEIVEAYYKLKCMDAQGKFVRNVRCFKRSMRVLWLRYKDEQKDVLMELPWGKFHGVLPEHVSSTVWKYGYFDTSVGTILSKVVRPGSVVMDVGAHFGYFSQLAAFLTTDAGAVHAFEPTSSTFEQLAKNTAQCPNVLINNVGLGAECCSMQFNDYGVIHSSLNSVGAARTRNISGKAIEIEVTTLDNYINKNIVERVDVIKMDVESMEQYVLKGGTGLYERFLPSTVIEMGARTAIERENSDFVYEYFTRLGYEKYCLEDGVLKRRNMGFRKYEYDNVLFLHERAAHKPDILI